MEKDLQKRREAVCELEGGAHVERDLTKSPMHICNNLEKS